MKSPKYICALAVVFPLLGISSWADEGHRHDLTPEEVGSVNFQNSCKPELAADFNRAVALLHSFQYEQSRGAFEAIAKKDPNCAMAQWGAAMSHYHGLWKNGDLDAGRIAWQKASMLAAANKNTTSREGAFIEALGEIYKTDSADGAAHAIAYEHRLEALHAAYPEDSEATIFYALAIRVTAPDTDKTYAHQRRCGELLEPIFQQQPHHPGIAHYLIHCYDYPALAERGLSAARAYAKIAPASAHAQHMPSHIFTRVGAWEDSIDSNIHSKLTAAEAEKTSTNGEARDQRLHAMDYLEYAYLQRGLDQKAKGILDEMNSLNSVSGLTATGNYAGSAIPARYAIERQDWKAASQLKPDIAAVSWAQALTWEAIGEGAARSGDITRAKEAERQLASLRDKTLAMRNKYWANQIEVQRLEVGAWILQAAGDDASAIKTMRSAAELEETMDKDAVTPGAITPGREMLAELLLLNSQPSEALAAYEAVLQVAPNRFNVLFGAATSAERAGWSEKAIFYYRKLDEVAKSGERPQLQAVRQKLVASRN
jgi:tetratricopeptide (TPR) repeat protein